jgi:sulfite exporter TauE/SafE
VGVRGKSESTETGKIFASTVFGGAFAALGLGWWLLSPSQRLAQVLLALGIIMIVLGLIRRERSKALIQNAQDKAKLLTRK